MINYLMIKQIILMFSFVCAACSGELKELKKENETQNQMLGRAFHRIKTLEEFQDDFFIEYSDMNSKINNLEQELNRVEKIMSTKQCIPERNK